MKINSQRGFTLIELLVVIAVIGILSAIAMPFLNSARNKAKSSAIKASLSQVQKQAEIYYTNYGDYGSLTKNGANNYVWPCAQDGTTGGSSWVWAMNSPGYSSTIFGSTTADGSLLNLVNSLKGNSGWNNSLPTVFCIAYGTGNTASSWAMSVRDPSNMSNYFCNDSSGNIKYEINPPMSSPDWNSPPTSGNFAGIHSYSPGIVTCN